jgi:cyanophycinase
MNNFAPSPKIFAVELNVKGTLIPVGGSEDKGEESHGLDFIEEGILSHVVRESGGPDANIVVIPTASSIPVEVGDNYLKAFDMLGCKNVQVLNIRKRKQSEEPAILSAVEQANCIMFSGGDQSRIAKKIGGTLLHEILMRRYREEPVVIAGTSAGAMAMSNEMIAGGSSTEALLKGAVIMRKGLGLIPDLIIDTHFIQRGRFGRLAEAVAIFPNLIGLGLAEDTGVIIKNCNDFKVIGSGMVILFDASQLTHNRHATLQAGTPTSLSNLVTHILANGDRFSISDRRVDVLPMEEEFV